MNKTLYIDLDVHKASISASVAENERNGEIRFLGNIPNTPAALVQLVAKLAHHNADLNFCYESGPYKSSGSFVHKVEI